MPIPSNLLAGESIAGAAQNILAAALGAANPHRAAGRSLSLTRNRLWAGGEPLELAPESRIYLVGFGKAVAAMGAAAVEALPGRIAGGVLIGKHVAPADLARLPAAVRMVQGSHPVPGGDSVQATQMLLDSLEDVQPQDVVICLISGGGSALFTSPRQPVTLADLQALTRLLLASGATIQEINTLRKHLDAVKGGGLARKVYPARVAALILSDVVGSPFDSIASGPTSADPTTFADCTKILERYGLLQQAPDAVREVLQQGASGELDETLKPGDPILGRVANILVGSNAQSAGAALAAAQEAGLNALLLSTYLQGEARQAGQFLSSILKEIAASGRPLQRPACIVVGGETTVTLRGQGLGGRNLELALGAVPELHGLEKVALITLATDGEDGPTDAAGACVTGKSMAAASRAGLNPQEFLNNNDSYTFFKALGGLLQTGPTGTNVNDLVFLFAY